jgi:hypothetical protein
MLFKNKKCLMRRAGIFGISYDPYIKTKRHPVKDSACVTAENLTLRRLAYH